MMLLEYLWKSSACMGAFLLFYQFLLEKENMHVFKRFFLLVAIVLSLTIPTLVFTEYVEVPVEITSTPIENIDSKVDFVPAKAEVSDIDVINRDLILLSIYILGVIGFGLRFIKHLFQIGYRIKTNPKRRIHFLTQVLLLEKMPPHTFFNYIFLNKKEVEKKNIPKEVLLHEETHAKQLHSIDVLFIELLQVIFWFNPLIYLFKKNIKLNHEFLADSAVLKEDVPSTTYQNTLLSYLSTANEYNYQSVNVANAINYSSTRLTVLGRTFEFGSTVGQVKKRFTIMKKRTSKQTVFLRTALLIPLITLLLLGFSQKEIKSISKENPVVKDFVIKIDKDGKLQYEGKEVTLSDISQEIENSYKHYSKGERKNFITAYILYDENNLTLISAVDTVLRTAGFGTIKHVSQRTLAITQNGIRKKSEYHGLTLQEARNILKGKGDSDNIIWFDIKNGTEIWFLNEQVPLHQLAEVIKKNVPKHKKKEVLDIAFYSDGTIDSRFIDEINTEIVKTGIKSIKVFSEEYIIPKDSYEESIDKEKAAVKLVTNKLTVDSSNQQEGATREQIKEYNALAKKYNSMLSEKHFTIQMKDVERLKYLYNLMADKQREDGEPFPDFPNPPPPPEAPELPKNISGEQYASNKIDSVIRTQDPYDNLNALAIDLPPPPNQPTTVQKENTQTGFIEVDGQTLFYTSKEGKITYYNRWGQKVNRNGNIIDSEQTHAEDVIEEQVISKIYKDDKVVAEFNTENVRSVPPKPPLPPEPINPLDHVIDMAKKGAIFYYEGKEISSDKAIDLLKKNKSLHIQTSKYNSDNPRVKISKKPIKIGALQNKNIVDSLLGYSVTIKKETLSNSINPERKKTDTNTGFEHMLKTAEEKDITFYHKNEPISINKARRLLSEYKDNAAIVSHVEHPELKRLDIITDIDKSSSDQIISEQYKTISL